MNMDLFDDDELIEIIRTYEPGVLADAEGLQAWLESAFIDALVTERARPILWGTSTREPLGILRGLRIKPLSCQGLENDG